MKGHVNMKGYISDPTRFKLWPHGLPTVFWLWGMTGLVGILFQSSGYSLWWASPVAGFAIVYTVVYVRLVRSQLLREGAENDSKGW